MPFLGLILIALAKIISLITSIYTFIVAGSAIISWVRPDPYNPIVVFLYQATNPLYRQMRRYLPSFLYSQSIDWTPMIVILLLVLIETIVGGGLYDLGNQLRFGQMIPLDR